MHKQSGVCRFHKPPKGFKRAHHLVINTSLVLIITIWVIFRLKVSVSPEHKKLFSEDIKETADMLENKENGIGALKLGRKGLISATGGGGGVVGKSEASDESISVETGEEESSTVDNYSQADEEDDEEELSTELLDDLTEAETYSQNDANSESI